MHKIYLSSCKRIKISAFIGAFVEISIKMHYIHESYFLSLQGTAPQVKIIKYLSYLPTRELQT